MAVSFERYGRLYYLDPGEREYRVGDRVLVPTDAGPEVAECVWAPEWVTDGEFTDLPLCPGPAEQGHLDRDAENRRRRAQAKLVAKKLVRRHDLPMKVVGIDYLDGDSTSLLTVIYFTAPHRVDFRALVGDLGRALQTRIDLRQVGSREAASITGGLGSCGRDLCCATFLKNFEPVSLRMAKAQDLPPNPMKISGACGRLMCCLKYEHPLYVEFAREAPAVGTAVSTEAGDGVVVGHSVPADALLVRMSDGSGVSSCSRAGVCGSREVFATRETVLAAPPVEAVAAAASEAPAVTEVVAVPEPAAEPEAASGPAKPRRRRRRTGPAAP